MTTTPRPQVVLVYPRIPGQETSMVPPLSLLYVATPLQDRYDVTIIDQRITPDWPARLRAAVQAPHVLCAGISTMTGPQIAAAIDAARVIRQAAPHLPLVWGGVHPSLLPEETIRHELVDIIVIGDGEATFRELVDALVTGGDKQAIPGLMYKDGPNIIATPPRPQFPLSDLPNLAFDLIDWDRYQFHPLLSHARCIPLITSRGCPHRCAYCYNLNFSQRRWNALSPHQTLTLIQDLLQKFDLPNLYLLDDNFFVNLPRVRDICTLLAQHHLQVNFYNANCRVDTILKMDDNLLQLLKQSGFHQLYIGVESGSDAVLRKIAKDITVDQVLRANRRLQQAGITPLYSFMAGFPFETRDDVHHTLTLMRRLMLDNPTAIIYKLQLFTPFPGTALFHQVRDLGMTFPATLAGWAAYHYDKLHYPGFAPDFRAFLEKLNFYTLFLDPKPLAYHSRYIKSIAGLYSRFLQFRIQHGFYAGLYEHLPVQWAQSLFRQLTAS